MIVDFLRHWRAVTGSTAVTLLLMIAANLVPLAGVLALGWDVYTVLIVYWLENGVVGLVNVPKILLTTRNPQAAIHPALVVYQSVFFLIHYGFFWLGHGIFLLALTGSRPFSMDLFGAPRAALAEPVLLVAGAGLLASHVAALLTGYVHDRDYLRVTAQQQMFRPYPRMVVLHMTIIFGGVALAAVGQPVALVGLLVVLKTAVDVGLYLKERADRPREPAPIALSV